MLILAQDIIVVEGFQAEFVLFLFLGQSLKGGLHWACLPSQDSKKPDGGGLTVNGADQHVLNTGILGDFLGL